MKTLLATLLALMLEAAAFVAIYQSSTTGFWFYLPIHALASVCFAVAVVKQLPANYQAQPAMAVWLLFNCCFFLPVLGLLGVGMALVITRYFPHLAQAKPYDSIALPEFELTLHHPQNKLGQGGLKARLSQTDLPVNQRLQALLSLDGIPLRIASPMMQELLNDAVDDIRLVAYGILDAKEKLINSKIHQEKEKLATLSDDALRLVCLRHLAELNWEQAYTGLSKGDLRLHTLELAEHYVVQALKLAANDAGLWLLRGRIQHEQRRLDEALHSLKQAQACGMPESRVLPYLAELAFDRKQYQEVKQILGQLKHTQLTQKMQDVIRYWTAMDAHS